MVAALVAGVAACSDGASPSGVTRDSPSLIRRIDRTGLVTVRDIGIDLSDTHYATEAELSVSLTIASDTLIRNPFTGAMVYEFTIPGRIDTLQIEAGFDGAGRTHLNGYKLSTPDSQVAAADELRAVQMIDDAKQMVSGLGQPFAYDATGGSPPAMPTSALGNVGAIDLDQFVGGGGGGGGPGGGPLMELLAPAGSPREGSTNRKESIDARGRRHVTEDVLGDASLLAPAVSGGARRVVTERVHLRVSTGWLMSGVKVRSETSAGRSRHVNVSEVELRRTRAYLNPQRARERARRRRARVES